MKRVLFLIIGLMISLCSFSQIVTREQFFSACDSLEIHHPYVVWAQARLESGNFKSDNYKCKKNCLGIYDSYAKRYASYNSWQECLSAYKTKFQYKCDKDYASEVYLQWADEEYLRWVAGKGYAKFPDEYYNTVIQIVNQEKRKDRKNNSGALLDQ